MHGPISVQEGRGNGALQLRDAGAQRGHGDGVVAIDTSVPLELGDGREAELVAEEPPAVAVFVVLVFVEGQRAGGVLVHPLLVRTFHT